MRTPCRDPPGRLVVPEKSGCDRGHSREDRLLECVCNLNCVQRAVGERPIEERLPVETGPQCRRGEESDEVPEIVDSSLFEEGREVDLVAGALDESCIARIEAPDPPVREDAERPP